MILFGLLLQAKVIIILSQFPKGLPDVYMLPAH